MRRGEGGKDCPETKTARRCLECGQDAYSCGHLSLEERRRLLKAEELLREEGDLPSEPPSGRP
jgi:phosphoribosyl-dephospho-CoA transferase